MKKKPPLTTADIELFRQAMRDVPPLLHKKISHKALPKSHKNAYQSEKPSIPLFSDETISFPVAAESELTFQRAGLQNRQFRKLKAAKFVIEATLDLHGLNSEQANLALARFLIESVTRGMRCVLIIHGKSKLSASHPIIKNKVNHWLKQSSDVLAFCSAQAQHGGRGAVYVLLRGNYSPPLALY